MADVRTWAFARPDGGVNVTVAPEPPRSEPNAVLATEIPSDTVSRDAWVLDGSCVVVDPSRIKPPPPMAAPAGAVVAQDPRVDALGPQLAEQIAAGFQAMRRELQIEIAVEHRRAIEALTVASALQDGRQIDPGSFPALERILRDTGRPVTSDEIIAAADEQARRSIELAGGL